MLHQRDKRAKQQRVCIQYYDEHGKGAHAAVEFLTDDELDAKRAEIEQAGGVIQPVDKKRR